VFGVLLFGGLTVIVVTYASTEYLLSRSDVRRRVLVGDGWPLMPILFANAASLVAICIGSVLALFMTGIGHYAEAMLLCFLVQGIWLARHLWFYHREHLRLNYE
jgi:hypothetical protein